MKRLIAVVLLAAGLASGVPAHADGTVVVGHVRTPALTPTVPRSLHLVSERANGIVGWVARLPDSDAIRDYDVVPLSAAPGALDIDVWFYRDLEGATGTGDPCPRDGIDRPSGAETGTACPGARYAVVVLFAGADVQFELSVR